MKTGKKIRIVIVIMAIIISSASYGEKGAYATDGRDYGKCEEKYTLGWLICPVLYTLADAIDKLEEAINGFF